MPKCVEVTAVMSDGTVFRWEGHDAFILGAQMPLPCEQKAIGMITPPEPTTTKPLRKTTVIGGLPTYAHSTAVCIGGKFYCLPDLMPDGYLAGTDPNDPGEGSVRITAEVVPVGVTP